MQHAYYPRFKLQSSSIRIDNLRRPVAGTHSTTLTRTFSPKCTKSMILSWPSHTLTSSPSLTVCSLHSGCLANVASVILDLAHVQEAVNPFPAFSVRTHVYHHSLVVRRRHTTLVGEIFCTHPRLLRVSFAEICPPPPTYQHEARLCGTAWRARC